MILRYYKPTTPSLWHTIRVKHHDVDKIKNLPSYLRNVIKRLTKKIPWKHGIGYKGHRTIQGKTGKTKRRYKIINFRRDWYDQLGTIKAIIYDANRSCNLALVMYKNFTYDFILQNHGLKVGDQVQSFNKDSKCKKIKLGNSMPLNDIPIGTTISNISLYPHQSGTIVRSAGNGAILLSKVDRYAIIWLPSKEVWKFLLTCSATIGKIGNIDHFNCKLGKAGSSFHCNWRPIVWGVAKNAVDHKHGGGEGWSSIGLWKTGPVNFKGLKTLGFKTRRRKKWSNMILKRWNFRLR